MAQIRINPQLHLPIATDTSSLMYPTPSLIGANQYFTRSAYQRATSENIEGYIIFNSRLAIIWAMQEIASINYDTAAGSLYRNANNDNIISFTMPFPLEANYHGITFGNAYANSYLLCQSTRPIVSGNNTTWAVRTLSLTKATISTIKVWTVLIGKLSSDYIFG